MDLLTPVLIGIGLSMDCFAVSLAIGSMTTSGLKRAAAIIAICFGMFQAGMTVLGWFAGISVITLISAYDHWVAFVLLLAVGGKMIWEGIRGEEEQVHADVIRVIPLIALSLATSIDALAVGVSFGVLRDPLLMPALIIGIVCCSISFAGVILGERLENLLGNRMEILGGLILILIGVKILDGHMFL
jgi:manganese efflux pump family protein